MTELWIWSAAAAVYAIFRLWYDNWRGPLTNAEIEGYIAQLESSGYASAEALETFKRFMDADDGREFVMLNLVLLSPGPLPDPTSGIPTNADTLLQRYLKSFLPQLLRRAGHPLLQARKVGDYIDSWNVEPDPGWTLIGYMRYRSRRDLMEMVILPVVQESHAFKIAAMPATLAFPTQPVLSLYAGPRIWLALVLALVAALTHISMIAAGTA